MIIGLFKYRIDVFLNQQKYNPAELIFIEGVFLHQYVSIIHQIEGLKIHHNGLKILLVNKKRSFPLGETHLKNNTDFVFPAYNFRVLQK